MAKHIHIHVAPTRTKDADPAGIKRDADGRFATSSGGASHHAAEADKHARAANALPVGHPDKAHHEEAFARHSNAAKFLRNANHAEQQGATGTLTGPQSHIRAAENEAQQAAAAARNVGGKFATSFGTESHHEAASRAHLSSAGKHGDKGGAKAAAAFSHNMAATSLRQAFNAKANGNQKGHEERLAAAQKHANEAAQHESKFV